MNIHNPYKITPSEIKINNRLNVLSGKVSSETLNVGYYDDTKIKERISLLESEVTDIQMTDNNFEWRLQQLESIDHDQYATKTQVNGIEARVSSLETTPVGITNEQMDEIFD